MTDLNDREEPLGDRVKVLEIVVAHMADRIGDVEQLAVATNRLTESTEGLDSALREVGAIREQRDAMVSAADDATAAAEAVVPQLKALVPRRWFWVTVACLAVVTGIVIGVVAYGAWDRHQIREQLSDEHQTVCHLQAELGDPC